MLVGFLPGCGDKTPPAPVKLNPPVTIGSGPGATRTFEAGSDIPPATFTFDDAPGFVRITLEAVQASGDGLVSAASSNDSLFRAVGHGRIEVSFRKPWAGHDEGRVTIRCVGGAEDSSAEFEPSLWFRDKGAVVAMESPPTGEIGPITPGREVVLVGYAAKIGPKAVGLTIKATFGPEALPVRISSGVQAR